MAKNILFCAVGIILGAIIGFFFANSVVTPTPLAAIPASSIQSGPGSAPPLDPSRANEPLPPNHPNINGAGGDVGSSAQAQTLMDTADRNPRDFDAQMQAAAYFYQQEAFDKTTLYLTRALAIKPNDADALTGMGFAKYDTGDYAAAAAYWERALAERPNDADLRTELGNSYVQRTPPDYDRALSEYRKALQIDPKHEQTLQKLAATALLKGDKTTARETIERLATVNPSNPALSSLRSSLQGSSNQ